MGYDLHITRADDWVASEQAPITAEEWLACVEKDPDLVIDPRDNGPYFALWLNHRIGDDYPWFDWSKGAVYTKHPDSKTLGKMLEIARLLGAKVQGDDGEVYTSPGDR